MNPSTPKTDKLLSAFCAFIFVIPAVYFDWLVFSLIHLVGTAENGEMYRTKETILAAIGFPGMFVLLTAINRWFLRKAFAKPLA